MASVKGCFAVRDAMPKKTRQRRPARVDLEGVNRKSGKTGKDGHAREEWK